MLDVDAPSSLSGRELGTPVRFRTNGIREVVGERLTSPFAVTIGRAVARVAPPDRPIAIGRDARTSSAALADLLASTLMLDGRNVIDLGLLPTPAVQYELPRVGAGFGVVITASHNPPEYNGFKCLDERGRSISRETETRIEDLVKEPDEGGALYDGVGDRQFDSFVAERYLSGMLGLVDAAKIASRNLTVVLDCGNGATAVTSPELLRRLGCRVITMNHYMDGRFPGRPSEPNEQTLQNLARVVPAVGADLGIAHDGDGDRTIFVDGKGRIVPGDQSLGLLAREAVRVVGGGAVVTPVSTSELVEDLIHPLGGRVEYTPVGSPGLSRAVERTGAVLGGEENGGVIFPRWQFARDGAMTAAAMLDVLAQEGASLSDLIENLPRYASVKEKLACPPERAQRVLAGIADELRISARRVVTLDGWKIYTDGGWLLLRASGTEPVVRVYAETRDLKSAQRLATTAMERIRERLAS